VNCRNNCIQVQYVINISGRVTIHPNNKKFTFISISYDIGFQNEIQFFSILKGPKSFTWRIRKNFLPFIFQGLIAVLHNQDKAYFKNPKICSDI